MPAPRVARSQQLSGPGSSCSADAPNAIGDVGIVMVSEITGAARQLDALMQANQLVSSEFYPSKQTPVEDALSYNTYRIRHAAQNITLHMREGSRDDHFTLLATAQRPEGERQRPRLRPRRHWGAGAGGGGGFGGSVGEAVGVCNVTLRYAGDGIAAAAGCLTGAPFAMVTNMTVVPEWRRHGVAQQLMRSSVVTASCRMSEKPHFMALLCYKGYTPAYRLYSSFGFVPTVWMDPDWQEDARRSRIGKPRRLLMVKPLRQSVVPKRLSIVEPKATATAVAAAAAVEAAAQSDSASPAECVATARH